MAGAQVGLKSEKEAHYAHRSEELQKILRNMSTSQQEEAADLAESLFNKIQWMLSQHIDPDADVNNPESMGLNLSLFELDEFIQSISNVIIQDDLNKVNIEYENLREQYDNYSAKVLEGVKAAGAIPETTISEMLKVIQVKLNTSRQDNGGALAKVMNVFRKMLPQAVNEKIASILGDIENLSAVELIKKASQYFGSVSHNAGKALRDLHEVEKQTSIGMDDAARTVYGIEILLEQVEKLQPADKFPALRNMLTNFLNETKTSALQRYNSFYVFRNFCKPLREDLVVIKSRFDNVVHTYEDLMFTALTIERSGMNVKAMSEAYETLLKQITHAIKKSEELVKDVHGKVSSGAELNLKFAQDTKDSLDRFEREGRTLGKGGT